MLETIDFSAPKMPKQEYKAAHDELVEKLILLQQEARQRGVGVVVLVEGWSGAGKGTRISDLIYHLDARATSVYVTPDLSEQEVTAFKKMGKGVTGYNPIMKNFWQALGERGTFTFYDRGWYTSVMQQAFYRAFGNISKKETKKIRARMAKEAGIDEEEEQRFQARDIANDARLNIFSFEEALVNDGYVLVKIFVHARKSVLKKRLKTLASNPDTAWRVNKEKLAHVDRYNDVYAIFDSLLAMSDFDIAPWTIINGEDPRGADVSITRAIVDALDAKLHGDGTVDAKADEQTASTVTATDVVADDVPVNEMSAEEAAQKASAYAPRTSNFPVVADYPQLDHSAEAERPSLDEKEYREALKREQKRLGSLELEMYQARVPLMIMYEGWDAAGKGGNIKRVAQALDARAYTIFPSPAPTKVELAHPHLWRYWTRLPKAGHVGIYDRSWYGRVLVERVEEITPPEAWARGYDEINAFEYAMVEWGAILLKFWVDVTPDTQLERFKAREADPAKQWKITPDDWRNRDKYPQYKAAINDMFRLTSTEYAPWIILESDSKYYARIKALQTINEALEKRLK